MKAVAIRSGESGEDSRPPRPRSAGVYTLALVSSALLLASCTGNVSSAPSAPSGDSGTAAGGTGGGGGGANGQAGGFSGGPGSGGGGVAVPGVPGILQSGFTRLTRAEYRATVKDAFGVDADVSGIPEDGRVGPFTSNIALASDPVQPFLLASEDLAALIVPSRLPTCSAATASTCIPTSYQKPFERLFRRPVTAAELTAWSAMLANLEKAGLTAENATRAMVTSALLRPDSMFRTTPLTGDAARARRLAEHLSYALWDAPPDVELTSAVAGAPSDLGTRLLSHAGRLGKDPRAVPVLARFLAQWLRLDLDNKLGDAAYATSPLYLELLAYVRDALTTGAPVTSFVNGTRGFVHKNNLVAYGLTSVAGTAEVAPVTWPATSSRRGIIGEEAIMDPTRHPDVGRRAIFRGLLVRSSLLCQAVPPPSAELVALAGVVTDRTTDARCSGCHLLLEPVGAAFAVLDRDFTGTAPAVRLNNSDELAGTYPQLTGLLDAIAGSRTFADCFARQLWAFFLEQTPASVDAASVAEIAAVVRSGGSLGDLLGQMVVSLEARSQAAVPWCAGQ
jgi:Protein of unknown function (DUF1592)/Protein of unknown function (DUF1587)/Protein of unknown function (DUF1588)